MYPVIDNGLHMHVRHRSPDTSLAQELFWELARRR
jgi:hypothetical protein